MKHNGLCLLVATTAVAAVGPFIAKGQPIPTGSSDLTVSYQTTGGTVSYSASMPFLPDAVGPPSSTPLASSPNLAAFNSVNSFGRRTFLANSAPQFQNVLNDGETLIAHAVFKQVPTKIGDDFFPDLVENGNITVTVGPIEFDECVQIDPSTVMMHVLWNGDQVDQLFPEFYVNLHNHHIDGGSFREVDDFLAGGIFSDFPVPNYVFNDIDVSIKGNGTRTLQFQTTFPYSTLENLESTGADPPKSLPAPQGFLEPFHFHIEYAVTHAACARVPVASTSSAALFGLIMIVSTFGVLWRRSSSLLPARVDE